jgi:hypothetical protein
MNFRNEDLSNCVDKKGFTQYLERPSVQACPAKVKQLGDEDGAKKFIDCRHATQ